MTGTVLVRVTDTDRGAGNLVLDTVTVDHLVLRWGPDAGWTAPAEPQPDPSPEPTHPARGNGKK